MLYQDRLGTNVSQTQKKAFHTEGLKAFGDFYGPFQNDLIAASTGIEKGGVVNISLNVSQMMWSLSVCVSAAGGGTARMSVVCSCHACG